MKSFTRSTLFVAVIVFCAGVAASAQQKPLSPEEEKQKIYESIQTETDRLTNLLKLESWQTFYVDSVLTHNVFALQEEFNAMRDDKVSNSEIYYDIQDKWTQATYDAYKTFFNEAQWAKYLKSGGAKEQRMRDKRREKR